MGKLDEKQDWKSGRCMEGKGQDARVQLRGVQLEIPEKSLSGDISWATGYESEVQKKVVD